MGRACEDQLGPHRKALGPSATAWRRSPRGASWEGQRTSAACGESGSSAPLRGYTSAGRHQGDRWKSEGAPSQRPWRRAALEAVPGASLPLQPGQLPSMACGASGEGHRSLAACGVSGPSMIVDTWIFHYSSSSRRGISIPHRYVASPAAVLIIRCLVRGGRRAENDGNASGQKRFGRGPSLPRLASIAMWCFRPPSTTLRLRLTSGAGSHGRPWEDQLGCSWYH